MDREIAKIPPLCAALKAQAQGRRGQVVRQQEQRQSALAARATHEKTNGQAITGDDAAYDIAKASNVFGAYDAYLSALSLRPTRRRGKTRAGGLGLGFSLRRDLTGSS